MKIPKYIEQLIKRRERLAWELINIGTKLDEWLEKNDIPTGDKYTTTGCMIYCEPSAASRLLMEDILNKE